MFYALLRRKLACNWIPCLLILAIYLIPLPGFSQTSATRSASPITAETRVNPEKATIGDIVTYTLQVRHDAGIDPSMPEFTPPKGLEFVDQGANPPAKIDAQVIHEFWFRLRADRVGDYSLPPLPISFTVSKPESGAGKIPGKITAPEVKLEIQSILHLQGEPKDIRDIKPIEALGRDWRPIILGFLGFALAAAVIVYLWRRRKKHSIAEPASVPENLSPQELALRELNQLQARGLLAEGRIREYYFQLSEIFRRYLGGKYEFPAPDWTTEEIEDYLISSAQLDTVYQERIVSILKNTDLVKFAKATVTSDTNMMEEMVIFIQATSREEKQGQPSQTASRA